MKPKHTVVFHPSGRGKAQCAPDPKFPNGMPVIIPAEEGAKRCEVALPYPAPECGLYSINCSLFRLSILITAAGRADDPISVSLPCKATVQ